MNPNLLKVNVLLDQESKLVGCVFLIKRKSIKLTDEQLTKLTNIFPKFNPFVCITLCDFGLGYLQYTDILVDHDDTKINIKVLNQDKPAVKVKEIYCRWDYKE